jgi:hypothetical protein
VAAPVWAQSTGTTTGDLKGRVVDDKGGPLPGVTVTATNRETARINNTNTAANVIAYWQSLGTNAPGRNAVLAFKDDGIDKARDFYVQGEADTANAEKQAKIEKAQREAGKWRKE